MNMAMEVSQPYRRKIMTKMEILKSILLDREPGEGYFGGAEGFIRMIILMFILLAVVIAWVIFL